MVTAGLGLAISTSCNGTSKGNTPSWMIPDLAKWLAVWVVTLYIPSYMAYIFQLLIV